MKYVLRHVREKKLLLAKRTEIAVFLLVLMRSQEFCYDGSLVVWECVKRYQNYNLF